MAGLLPHAPLECSYRSPPPAKLARTTSTDDGGSTARGTMDSVGQGGGVGSEGDLPATPSRSEIHRELDLACERFHSLLRDASASDLRRRSDGTRSNNRQLLFHRLFGYVIVRCLLPLVRFFVPSTRPRQRNLRNRAQFGNRAVPRRELSRVRGRCHGAHSPADARRPEHRPCQFACS
jgi:hypothetical protein